MNLLEYFKQESETLLKTVYGIDLGDITDEKEIVLHFHLNETPYQFVCLEPLYFLGKLVE